MNAKRIVGRFLLLGVLGSIAPMASPICAQGRQGRPAKLRLNARIGEPDETWVRSRKQVWDNPTVYVDPAGVYLSMGGALPTKETERVDDLATALVGLPVSAWPHGRVILLLQSARVPLALVGQPEPRDTAYQRLKKAQQVLKNLGIKVVFGPVSGRSASCRRAAELAVAPEPAQTRVRCTSNAVAPAR